MLRLGQSTSRALVGSASASAPASTPAGTSLSAPLVLRPFIIPQHSGSSSQTARGLSTTASRPSASIATTAGRSVQSSTTWKGKKAGNSGCKTAPLSTKAKGSPKGLHAKADKASKRAKKRKQSAKAATQSPKPAPHQPAGGHPAGGHATAIQQKGGAATKRGAEAGDGEGFGVPFSKYVAPEDAPKRVPPHMLRHLDKWGKGDPPRNAGTPGRQGTVEAVGMQLLQDYQVPMERKLTHEASSSSSQPSSPLGDSNAFFSRLAVDGKLRANEVPFQPIAPLRPMKVATLSRGLDRVLFNPGVHVLKDPRTGVYNYDPSLNTIPDVDLFDFQALTPYITASKDPDLRTLAQQNKARFYGSTSSLTGILSQTYFLVSGWKFPSFAQYSPEFSKEPREFSAGAKMPASVVLRPQEGLGSAGESAEASIADTMYAVDADKGAMEGDEATNYVLTQLGKSMEKMLTVPQEEFNKYLRVNRPDTPTMQDPEPEAYHYVKAGERFVMRSQLDCSDERLPGKTFDLKSRAVVSVRHDRANWFEASGYQITKQTGLWQSFERERYDMTRAAFLKYYMQAKIGCMDGIFVAYHNAAKVFGFEYYPIERLAEQIFGSVEMAEQSFKLSVALTEKVLEKATSLHPGKQVHLTWATQEASTTLGGNPDSMYVYVECHSPDEDVELREMGTSTSRIDVVVDRYVNGFFAQGPIDLKPSVVAEALKSRAAQEQAQESEGKSRLGSSSSSSSASDDPEAPLPEPRLQLDYSIRVRDDLHPGMAEFELEKIRKRQRSITQMVMPNINAVNDRERQLQAALAKNPAALERYREDKRSGVARGLPRAPGQIELFLPKEKEGDEGDAGDIIIVKNAEEKTADDKEQEQGKKEEPQFSLWKPANRDIADLRKLARRGAQADREERRLEELPDGVKVFESTSSSSSSSSS